MESVYGGLDARSRASFTAEERIFRVRHTQTARVTQVETVTGRKSVPAVRLRARALARSLILAAFIPSRATRSHAFFHLVFFHNLPPRVRRRDGKVLSTRCQSSNSVIHEIAARIEEARRRERPRSIAEIADSPLPRRKRSCFLVKAVSATLRAGRKFFRAANGEGR